MPGQSGHNDLDCRQPERLFIDRRLDHPHVASDHGDTRASRTNLRHDRHLSASLIADRAINVRSMCKLV
jgi:hypothetical protein